MLDLTTTGRKSGRRRTSHLISVPVGDTLALLGTNFGQRVHAGLGAQPRGRAARHRDATGAPSARSWPGRPTTPSAEQVFAASAGIYGGYLKYRQRITARRVRVFVLEPA